MEYGFLKVLNNSISVSWLALAVLLVRPLLKKTPKKSRCVLWALVGLRLCLPVSIRSAFSLIPSAQTVSQDIGYAAQPVIDSGIEAVNRALNPVISQAFAPTPFASANPLQIWLFIAAWVWLIGLTGMLLYAAVSYGLLRLRVAQSVPLRDNIRLSEKISTPFMMGVVRPRLYLPIGLEEEVMELAIAHEWAHVERRDHVFRPLGFILLAVYWFNPLLWLSYMLFCRDMELACDERVLQNLGPERKKDYSRALLACSAPRRTLAVCPLAFGESGVKGRIESILHYKAPPRWALIAAAALCIALALGFLTDPAAPDPETVYAPVLALYQTAASEKWSEEQMVKAGIDPKFSLYCSVQLSHITRNRGTEKTGYLFRDLDGDGVPELVFCYLSELIVGFTPEMDFYEGEIVDIYTVKGGQAVKLPLEGQTYLCGDGQILAISRSDGEYTAISLNRLREGGLYMTEGLLVASSETGEESWYQVANNDYSHRVPVDSEEASRIYTAYRGQRISYGYTPLADYMKQEG